MRGVYHIADRDCVSRYDIARNVLAAMEIGGGWVERGITKDFARSQNLPQELYGILPENTCLDVSKIEKDLDTRMPTFEEGVAMLRKELQSILQG
jgi:dTDP-4-dehydrorhamnose reductase